MKTYHHALIISVLTLLTQIGGMAWIFSMPFQRRWLVFPLLYAAFALATPLVAPIAGRVPLPCTGGPLVPRTVLTCVLNRHYVVPNLRDVAVEAAARIEIKTGRGTLYLDAGFPFSGLTLLPHLSHGKATALDLAFWYEDGPPPSPVGYFAYVEGPADCPSRSADLRWDFTALQPLFPDRALDADATAAGIGAFVTDPRVARIFLEPHLKARLGLSAPKVRFQGCRAARHDDHFHVEVARS